MFNANSRYAKIPVVEAETSDGKKVSAVKLRRLPYTEGSQVEVKGSDRLDLMAQRKYRNGTEFWRIADANTELEANDLVTRERPANSSIEEVTRFILVPES